MKKCNKCKKEKPLTEFSKFKKTKDGLQYQCKDCVKSYDKARYEANKDKIKAQRKAKYEANKEEINAKNKAWREANKDKIKAYREANKDKINAKTKDWRENNKDRIKTYMKAYREKNKNEIKAYNKSWREANKDRVRAKSKAYREDNKDEIKAWMRAYSKKRFQEDPIFRLTVSMRNRVCGLLRGIKSTSTEKIIGCSYGQLYLHLNYNDFKEPSHDHIIPLSWAETEEELYALCRWENLQGMELKENLDKRHFYCSKEKADSVAKRHPNPKIIKIILERQLITKTKYIYKWRTYKR